MSTVATCKANLTKAITAWETVGGKILASVLHPIAAPADVTRVELEERQATIETHLSQVRVALRTLADRRQALLNVLKSSSAQDEDVDACESYDQKDRVDAAVAAAESIATSHTSRLDETKELVKIKSPSSLSDTSDPNVGAQQQSQQQPRVTIVGDNVHQAPTTPVGHNTRPHVLPQRPTDAPNFFSHSMPQYSPTIGGPPYASTMPPVQLGKLTLEPFTGDITQFHRFWCTFELAVHNIPYTPPVYKFLYLQNFLEGEAQVVLQDLDPDECNYDQLVAALKRSTAHRLGLSIRDSHPRTFITFGGHPTTEVSGTAQLTLIDLLGEHFTLELTSKQTITLSQYPLRLSSEDAEFIQHHGLPLPLCSSKSVVPDNLIGIDHYWDILSSESPICLPSGMGPYAADIVAASQHDDDSAIKRLWSLDLIGVADDYNVSLDSKLESRIIREFNETSQFVDGVLYVRFPWRPDHPPLEDNKQLAYCRLMSQFKRLNQTPVAWQQYVKVIEGHITAGFVEEVKEYVFDDPRVYYIPHQAVYKESSATTKLRVVFDASSKRKDACSLNDCIYQGPTLLPELIGILLRARLHPLLLIADVEKAFHQIRLQHSQRDATHFLWLKDTSKPLSADSLRILRFTIPFGVNASPLLLAAAIKLYLHREQCPVDAEISRNTYVDSVILGASSSSEALKKYELAKSIFTRMHMNLREFLCNSTYVNSRIASQDRAINPSRASVLGIRWDFENDSLTIRLKTACTQVNTRRNALRALAATYDPLGLLTPFLVSAKIFIQDLWIQNLGWDTPFEQSQSER
ncbi:hypothetical protein GCK32_020510 [Trichostrongylus colubriformis]|uniref:Reverse transcriptase domain-containing protein n=1 Tax=Trichostrongylus colubriformis TaxID=6319 RepID=A0AAN8IKC0_TRICO